jgi:predicted ArsR family transcriptional regulator
LNLNSYHSREDWKRDEQELLAAIRKEPQSVSDLSMVCSMSRTTVKSHLRKLLADGVIERETVTGTRTKRTGRYRAVA